MPKQLNADDLWQIINRQVEFKDNEWGNYLRVCEKYYDGFKHNRKWTLSKKPRANVKLHATSEIIETLYSRLLFQLFFSGGEDFFDITSDDTKTARALTDRLRFLLNAPIDASGRTSFYALTRFLRYILKYGMGILAISNRQSLGRPVFENVSVHDIYWDPHGSPWIDDSRFVTKRAPMTVQELDDLRELPGYKIPSRKELKEVMFDRRNSGISSQADEHKIESAMRAASGGDVSGLSSYQLAEDEIMVFRVTSAERIYWITNLGGVPRLMLNAPNRMGFQPYVASTYRPILAAFGGVSVAQLMSGEHDLQQILTNLMLDLLDLITEPPRTTRAGNARDKPWGPGTLIPTDEAARDKPLPPDFPQELFLAYNESRDRALRTAGTNEMSIAGMPTPSNANRTLGGMQLQSAASDERNFGPLVEIEMTGIVPAITKALLIDRDRQQESGEVPGTSEDGQPTSIPANDLQRGKITRITVRGSTRMVGVQRLSGLIPTVLQYAFNPQLQQEAAQQGFTVDFEELNAFFTESTGVARKFKFYRPITPEEAQQRQQAATQEEQIKAQSRQQSDTIKAQTQIQLERLKQEGFSEDRAMELLELLKDSIPTGAAAENGNNGNQSS